MSNGEDKSSKTLPPSGRKLEEARKSGQVARSPDISGWAIVAVGSLLLPTLFRFSATRVVGLFDAATAGFSDPSSRTAERLLGQGLYVVGLVGGLVSLGAALVATLTQVLQSRPTFAYKKLKPDLKHLSPVAGAKKIFSANGLENFAKQVVKLAVVAAVATSVISRSDGMLRVGAVVPIGVVLQVLTPQVMALIRYVAIAGLLIGVGDWWWQRRRILTELRMSPKEARDELKREEGSPESKRARRKAALRLRRSRMSGSAKGADVLVVNPTHVAIGLAYRRERDAAPRVVARGADEVAARLRVEAGEADVPIVADRPLARSMYELCVVGDPVPVELYTAVANLLAEVYRIRPADGPDTSTRP